MRISKDTLIQSEQARSQLEQLLALPSSVSEPYTPSMKLIIEIDDPIGLAKREQPLTKYLSQVAPELIIKKVYEQVASEVAAGLEEKNVDASVTVTKH
ncbi:hypothetical protein [Alkalimarinus alittae]|uniref:Trigger factor n=1 Tax=Alkalimarinus alittae TaxID=2961619 RepID=A0ABY6N4R8_9ALTE|nr:hypothetical protein [Alkalimarinus alittae]UZE97115.1 hypothetical protein NKI27_05035 [Alkalimarinus alittae]